MKTLNFLLIPILIFSLVKCTSKGSNSNLTRNSANNTSTPAASNFEVSGAGDGILKLFADFNNPYILETENSNEIYLYVDLQADEFKKENGIRPPLNIALVIDRSGSMSGDKIAFVKKAAKFVVDNLTPEDYLTIIAYDDHVEVLSAAQKVTDKQTLKAKINELYDRGSTDLGGGMLKGYEEVKSVYKEGFVNRVLLLSDGLANVGITVPHELQNIVSSKAEKDGISISTFGVGANFNEDLMTSLAEKGSGNYYFIDAPSKIPEIFAKELDGLLSVVAQNTTLQINFPKKGFVVKRVFGYEYKTESGKVLIDFKDVFSSERKAVLVKFETAVHDKNDMIFTCALNYKDATKNHRNESVNLSRILVLTADQKIYSGNYNEPVVQQVALFETNEVMEQAMKAVDNGEYDEARVLLKGNTDFLNKHFESHDKTEELAAQYESNNKYHVEVDDIEKKSDYEKKMMQKSFKCDNYNKRKKK